MTTMLDKLSKIHTDLALLKLMVAANIAMTVALGGKIFLSH